MHIFIQFPFKMNNYRVREQLNLKYSSKMIQMAYSHIFLEVLAENSETEVSENTGANASVLYILILILFSL